MKRLILFCLLFPAAAFGQGIITQPKSVLSVVNGITRPVANATITVCAANAGGVPCSPALTGTIFKDAALMQPLSNPFTTDANGNYQFASLPGNYTVTETGSGFAGYSYQLTVGGSAGGAGTPLGALQGNCSGAFCGIPNTIANFSTGAISTSAAFTATGGGTFGGNFSFNPAPIISPLVLGQPIAVTPTKQLVASPLFLQADQFTNATNCVPGSSGEIDGCLNAANAMALTTGIPLIDARAFSGNQNLLNEVYIGKMPAPVVISSGSGSALGGGTYKVVYCVASPAFPTCASNVVSWESVVAVSAGQNIVMSPLVYFGTATSYTIAVTPVNGGSGTELFCTNLAGTSPTSGVTVSSLTNCTGAIIKNANISVTIVPPHYGIWTMAAAGNWCAYGIGIGSCGIGVAYTKQGTCGLRFFSQSSYLGDASGEGRSFQVTTPGTGITALASVCTDTNTISSAQPTDGLAGLSFNGYYRLEGLSATTAAGDTLSTAAYIFGLVDTSVISYLHGGVHTAIPVSIWQNVCCGSNAPNMQLEGNGFASPAVLQVGGGSLANTAPAGGPNATEFTCANCSIVHPANATPSILFSGTDTAVSFTGTTYLEITTTAATDEIQWAAAGNEGGTLSFDKIRMGGSTTGGTNAVIQIGNNNQRGVHIKQIDMGKFTVPYNYLPNTALNVTLSGTQQGFPGLSVNGTAAVGANPVTIIGNETLDGNLSTFGVIATGPVPTTITGTGACATITTKTGGGWTGTFVCTGTTGAATVTITPGSANAPTGFNCAATQDETHPLQFTQTGHSTSTCALSATSVTTNDVIVWSAIAF